MTAVVLGTCLLAAALTFPAPWLLARARWVVGEPRAALVLWQVLGLAAGLSTVGSLLALGLARLGDSPSDAVGSFLRAVADGDPFGGLGPVGAALVGAAAALLAWLLGITVLSTGRTWRSRDRQRDLVDLVSTAWPDAVSPSRATSATARVIDHPAAAAYCLPGQGSRVVVTTGALRLLGPRELDAVLAHEHAHLAERHDLLLLPFAAWSAALPWLGGPRRARAAVQQLVEMVADDRACAGRDRVVLAAALARLGAAGSPQGALGSTDAALLPRVRRLLDPPRRSAPARFAAYATATGLAVLPAGAAVLAALG